MFLIVGLGNDDQKYFNTYHNVGFLVVDAVVKLLHSNFRWIKQYDSHLLKVNFKGNQLLFAKPTTFMNASGVAVQQLKNKFCPDQIIVVHDDVDVPAGLVRIRTKGSAGTHNGMKSVINCISDNNFIRVRVGIGKPNKEVDLSDFVLDNIPRDSLVWQGIDSARDAIFEILSGINFQKVCQKHSK